MRLLILAGIVFILHSVFYLAFGGDFRYDSHGKRDPFSLPKTAEKKVVTKAKTGSLTNMKLEGVAVDPGGVSIAVINGNMYAEGDQLAEGIILKEVTDTGVVFNQNGTLVTIPLETAEESEMTK